ncbi:MAG: 6-phosphofructokinase, partial [uncultured Gemmatimonadaceae bacterium]
AHRNLDRRRRRAGPQRRDPRRRPLGDQPRLGRAGDQAGVQRPARRGRGHPAHEADGARHRPPRRDDPPHDQPRAPVRLPDQAARRQLRGGGPVGRADRQRPATRHRRDHHHRGRRLALDRAAPLRQGAADGGRAEDDRQRREWDGDHVRLRHRGEHRARGDRPSAHHGREPRPRDGAGGDGAARRVHRP